SASRRGCRAGARSRRRVPLRLRPGAGALGGLPGSRGGRGPGRAGSSLRRRSPAGHRDDERPPSPAAPFALLCRGGPRGSPRRCRIVTRTLLSPALRDRPLARILYAWLYLLGKRLAERRERRFFRQQISPGMVVFDVGANIGFYTTLFADLVGSTGRVHSFEPDPLSFDILHRRTARFGNVTINQTAVGDHSGIITLFCNRSNRADNRVHGSLGKETAETVEVPLTSLDD